MPRYLLVLDTDLPAGDGQLDLEPINRLITGQEQHPCQVTVLSLVDNRQGRLPRGELLLGGAVGGYQVGSKFPVAPKAGHDVSAAAGHRMHSAVRQLKSIGCQASGIISDEDLAKAVRSEARGHEYDAVILATGRQSGTRLARILRRDPVHQLRRRWRRRLIVLARLVAVLRLDVDGHRHDDPV
jgi:hypothetical protein